MSRPVALDLFCGAGGLSLGLERAGLRVAAAFDAWGPAVASYRANFPGHPCFLEDVDRLGKERLRELGVPARVDLLAGGPPCQGFSQQRIGEDEDPRNDLVLAFARAVLATEARAFIMENVRGLLGSRGKATLLRFRAVAEAAGYRVRTGVLDAADFGVPQHRHRVFVVGTKRGACGEFEFPAPASPRRVTVREALADLPPPTGKGTEATDPLHFETPLTELNRRRISLVPPGGGFEDLPVELRADCHLPGADRIGHRAVYGRLHPDRPAGTITAMFDSFTRGRFGHPLEPRNLTLREGARLQGFPDAHRFAGTKREITKQIGNAIPPPLAEAVARGIRGALEGRKPSTGGDDGLPLPQFA